MSDHHRESPALLWALIAGTILGGLSRLADHLGEPLATLGNLGWPWLVVAFKVGSMARTVFRGGIFGSLTLLVAVASYYVAMFFVDYGMSLDAFVVIGIPRFVVFWVAMAVVGGPIFGTAGAAWRSHRGWSRAVGIALLTGAIAGESLILLLERRSSFSAGILLLSCIGAALLPWLLLRGRERLVGITLAIGFALLGLATIATLLALFRSSVP